jgi:hypothetical protein
MLEVEDLTVGFGSVIIQQNVSFRVLAGSVSFLVMVFAQPLVGWGHIHRLRCGPPRQSAQLGPL